jgi:hypothetical protein
MAHPGPNGKSRPSRSSAVFVGAPRRPPSSTALVDRRRRYHFVAGLGGLRRLYLVLALGALCVNRRPREAGNRLWPTVAAGRWPLTSS